mgnify:CR=1 FL=1
MKKYAIAAVAIALSSACFAQTSVVSSANIVGYNKITCPADEYVLVSLDFEGASNTVSSLFSTLPQSSQVLIWDAGSQAYTTITKTRGGWGTAGTNTIDIGNGAFVKSPSATNVFFAGDVPTATNSSISVVDGYAVVAFPYPADVAFTNTALAKNASSGDKVSVWNNGWTTYSRTRGGWESATTNLTIKVGQAVLFEAGANASATEVMPYSVD